MIPYRLLSDVDSQVIRRYGILNDQVGREDAFLAGIPYPGVYVTDEDGVVVAKFFHDTYKKRNSPEMLIDAALGRLDVSDDAPSVRGGDEQVRISLIAHGGNATIRQGIVRQLVVRFELGPGTHIYGDPVPEGMVATRVAVSGPPGLVFEDPVFPPTETLRFESMGMELPVHSGRVDVVVPFYATGVLASETRALEVEAVEIKASVRYQAYDDAVCFAPKTERLTLRLALDVVDVPALGTHKGHGQREGSYSATPHMARLLLRKLREYPLGLPLLLWKTIRLELAARRRRRRNAA